MRQVGFLSILFLSFLTYCSKSSTSPQGNDANAGKLTPNALTKVTVPISAEYGGYVNVGSVQLSIPAGAIQADAEIKAELVDIPQQIPGAQKLGKAIKFSPEGLQFLTPADLTVCYEPGAAQGLNENSAMVYYKDDAGNLVGIAGQANPVTHCVKSHIEHFSSYVAVAQGQVAGNTAPTIAGANFLPTTPLAGIPLRVRTQITDVNGGATTGQIVSAFFIWCRTGDATCNLNPATATNKVPLQPDTTDDTVANRYYYLLPAAAVTLAGIDYRFQATDNLNVTTTTAVTTRTVPTAANGIQFNLTTLNIGAGFVRALTLQASDNAPTGPWQNISIENQSLSSAGLGSLARTGPSTIRLSTTGAGAGNITSTSGVFTASTNISVTAGLLTHIEITDLNQVHLTGTYRIGTNQTVDFDAVGYDAFGNMSTIRPTFTTTGGIGTPTVDLTGLHFTAGTTATTGSLNADIAGLSDSLSILVYVPPAVAATAPVDGATLVNYIGGNVAVTFTKPMDTSTLTSGTTTACAGSIQLSMTNFVDCVPMTSATPLFFSGNSLAILTPAAPLAGNTSYKVRVMASALDIFTYPMAGTYTSPTGFITKPDTTPPVPGNAGQITVSNVSTNSLTLNWISGTDDAFQPNGFEYKIVKDNVSAANIATVALADAKAGADLLQNWTPGITTLNVSGLTGASTYHFTVIIRDAGNNKVLYTPVTQMTTATWLLTGSMSVARTQHTATLLQNGKVLVAGGISNSTELSSTEIFDPASGVFSPGPNLSNPRRLHTATLLLNGKVALIGGISPSSAMLELYDPTTNTIATMSSLNIPRMSHSTELLNDGRLLIVAGYDISTYDNRIPSEIYDPISDVFTLKATPVYGNNNHTSVLMSSTKVMVLGYSGAEMYDIPSDAFTALGNGSYPNAGIHSVPAHVLPSGKVFSISQLGHGLMYDPGSDFFTHPIPLLQVRYLGQSVRTADGRVLLAGGYSQSGSRIAQAEIFDENTMSFSPAGDMQIPRHYHTLTVLNNGKVLAIGGSVAPSNQATASAELFN